MPNFSDSSFAILSSPQVGFSQAIWRTSSRILFGSAGRPRLRDCHRQNRLNAVRCHLRNVSGFTITSESRQSRNFASTTIARRKEAVVRRGFALRSWNKASCLRRNRFSAIKPTREVRNNRMKISNSVFYNDFWTFEWFGRNFCGPQVCAAEPTLGLLWKWCRRAGWHRQCQSGSRTEGIGARRLCGRLVDRSCLPAQEERQFLARPGEGSRSVRDGPLAGHNRARSGQKAAVRPIAHTRQDANEDHQLQHVSVA